LLIDEGDGPVADDQEPEGVAPIRAGSEERISGEDPDVAPVGQEEAPPAAEESPEVLLAAARAEAAENYDRFLRAVAELDNYRKRTARMRQETREETLRDVLLRIAPVLDNLRRALAQDGEDVNAVRQGVELIHNQLQDAFRSYGLEEIEAVGQPFDPNVHEALMQVDREDCPPGTVVDELEKGYRLRDKVVRPARVVVSKVGG
jgi:molecular chaperone GrpE